MIQKDKIAHFIYSVFGAAFFATITIAVFCVEKWLAGLIGFALMFLIGLYKEFVHDKWMGKGFFEIEDLIADFLGCVVGFLIFVIIYQ